MFWRLVSVRLFPLGIVDENLVQIECLAESWKNLFTDSCKKPILQDYSFRHYLSHQELFCRIVVFSQKILFLLTITFKKTKWVQDFQLQWIFKLSIEWVKIALSVHQNRFLIYALTICFQSNANNRKWKTFEIKFHFGIRVFKPWTNFKPQEANI